MAALGNAASDLVGQLGGEWPAADPRRVGLHHAHDLVDLQRADTAARAGPAGYRVRRRHVGIASVIEVEEGALRTFEEHVFTSCERRLDEPRGVVDVRSQPLAPRCRLLHKRVEGEQLRTHAAEQEVLVR